MHEQAYQHDHRIIEEEVNDQEYGDIEPTRPLTSDNITMNGRRNQVKTNNFYAVQNNEKLPIVNAQSRPYSEKTAKPSGRPFTQNSSTKSYHDRSSQLAPRDFDMNHSNRGISLPNRNNQATPTSHKTYFRVIPKNIPQDKERLYDETLNLKNLVHALRDENTKLKTKISCMEKDAVKFEKMMVQQQQQDGSYFERESAPKTSDHLIVSLKNKSKEIENTLHEREKELAEIRKSIKFTKIKELEVQLKSFAEESYRLKGILDQLLKEKTQNLRKDDNRSKLHEECMLQTAQIKVLERDQEQMEMALKALEQENVEYQVSKLSDSQLSLKKKKLSENEKKRKREVQRLKKLLSDKERDNANLKNELEIARSYPPAQVPSNKKSLLPYSKDEPSNFELERKKAENANLLDQLSEKNAQIQALEKQLREVTRNHTEKPISLHAIDKKSFRNEKKSQNSTLSSHVEAGVQPTVDVKTPVIQEKKVEVEQSKEQSPLLKSEREEEEETQENQEEEKPSTPEETLTSNRKLVPKKRVQKVRVEDVKDFGYELNLCLRTRGITFEELDNSVWPTSALKLKRISIKEVDEMLKSDPFNMTNEEDSLLIARYLIESNDNEYLFYEEDAEGDLLIVKSIFKKLIGPIPQWNDQSAKTIHNTIHEICAKNYGSLKENLRALCKNGCLTKRALQEACKLIEVNLTEDQIEFIITKLFEKTNNIQKLMIDHLFEIFRHRWNNEPEPKSGSEHEEKEVKKETVKDTKNKVELNQKDLKIEEKNTFGVQQKDQKSSSVYNAFEDHDRKQNQNHYQLNEKQNDIKPKVEKQVEDNKHNQISYHFNEKQSPIKPKVEERVEDKDEDHYYKASDRRSDAFKSQRSAEQGYDREISSRNKVESQPISKRSEPEKDLHIVDKVESKDLHQSHTRHEEKIETPDNKTHNLSDTGKKQLAVETKEQQNTPVNRRYEEEAYQDDQVFEEEDIEEKQNQKAKDQDEKEELYEQQVTERESEKEQEQEQEEKEESEQYQRYEKHQEHEDQEENEEYEQEEYEEHEEHQEHEDHEEHEEHEEEQQKEEDYEQEGEEEYEEDKEEPNGSQKEMSDNQLNIAKEEEDFDIVEIEEAEQKENKSSKNIFREIKDSVREEEEYDNEDVAFEEEDP